MNIVIYILIQVLTCVSAGFCLYRLLPEKEQRIDLCMALFFYFVCPYRLMYPLISGNVWLGLVFVAVPLVLYGFLWKRKPAEGYVLAGIGLIVIGVLEVRIYLAVSLLVCIGAILYKKYGNLVVWVLTWIPVAIKNMGVIRYVLWDQPTVSCELKSIMEDGYEISNLFRAFVSEEGKPGMGLVLMMGLLLFGWNVCVMGEREENPKQLPWVVGSVLFVVASVRYFPWDFLQRVDVRMLRLVSFLASPTFFFGVAQVCIAVLGAGAWMRFRKKQESSTVSLVSAVLFFAGCAETLILWKGCLY